MKREGMIAIANEIPCIVVTKKKINTVGAIPPGEVLCLFTSEFVIKSSSSSLRFSISEKSTCKCPLGAVEKFKSLKQKNSKKNHSWDWQQVAKLPSRKSIEIRFLS